MQPGAPTEPLTPAQAAAVAARGNVLVMAGAGTGKTKTLVARCLDCLEHDRASLDELLMVTFTEAAAAEMRLRLRRQLEARAAAAPDVDHWPRQLALFDNAHLGTLHGFCLRLVREHFHEAGLDPRLTLLDAGEARLLAGEALEELFHMHYQSADEPSVAVRNLIQTQGGGSDRDLRQLVLQLHHFAQTRPDAWLQNQIAEFARPAPLPWADWLLAALAAWRAEWLPPLQRAAAASPEIAELAGLLAALPPSFQRPAAAEMLAAALALAEHAPARNNPFKPFSRCLDEARFLASLAATQPASDPLQEDWEWTRHSMITLLSLTQEFAARFSERKQAAGLLDFHDLEQAALRLLLPSAAAEPSAIARFWRQKLRFIFVDEYQDINAIQDKILGALARPGAGANRFLVGDVKQSIYRFRLADPGIFRAYARDWQTGDGRVITLAENFRSQPALLDFVNSCFRLLMHEAVGGVAYDDRAALESGLPADPPGPAEPRACLLLRGPGRADEKTDETGGAEAAATSETTREARLLARQLQQLVQTQHPVRDPQTQRWRPVQWSDMAVLLRAPGPKASVFLQEFDRAGVPLAVARGGFYENSEILDLLSLLQLLDNPLQDVPCLAVLRSPLAGLSLDELAAIRLSARDVPFWQAIQPGRPAAAALPAALRAKLDEFLQRFSRWRQSSRQAPLSQCLEQIVTDTSYADWLRCQPRGDVKTANLNLLVRLARRFDHLQGQGLFRFLNYVAAQQEIAAEPEISGAHPGQSVRLLSIHQSKGLEFPVVVLAGLEKPFNEQDQNARVILDDKFGLGPFVHPPGGNRRYPSLPRWLAQKHQHQELRGEELRLLYVALTRARDTLILSARVTENRWKTFWTPAGPLNPATISEARSFADWLGLWFARHTPAAQSPGHAGRNALVAWQFVEDPAAPSATPAEPPAAAPPAAPPDPGAEPQTAEILARVLGWNYPHAAATSRAAKASVSELRRAASQAAEPEDEAARLFPAPRRRASRPRQPAAPGQEPLSAGQAGEAHHKFLQHVRLDATADLAAEAVRLVRENLLLPAEQAALDLPALAAFWQSPLGQAIRAQPPGRVKRELPFTARFSPAELAAITGQTPDPLPPDEFIVVQGVADLVVVQPRALWVVDFKTDRAGPGELPLKIQAYAPQLKLYAAALQKIHGRPVTRRALHFLQPGVTTELPEAAEIN